MEGKARRLLEKILRQVRKSWSHLAAGKSLAVGFLELLVAKENRKGNR